MPVDVDGDKWACEPCVRGHRSTKCGHFDRIMIRVKKPGRPLSTCPHPGQKSCSCRQEKLFMTRIRVVDRNGTCLCAPRDQALRYRLDAIVGPGPSAMIHHPGHNVPLGLSHDGSPVTPHMGSPLQPMHFRPFDHGNQYQFPTNPNHVMPHGPIPNPNSAPNGLPDGIHQGTIGSHSFSTLNGGIPQSFGQAGQSNHSAADVNAGQPGPCCRNQQRKNGEASGPAGDTQHGQGGAAGSSDPSMKLSMSEQDAESLKKRPQLCTCGPECDCEFCPLHSNNRTTQNKVKDLAVCLEGEISEFDNFNMDDSASPVVPFVPMEGAGGDNQYVTYTYQWLNDVGNEHALVNGNNAGENQHGMPPVSEPYQLSLRPHVPEAGDAPPTLDHAIYAPSHDLSTPNLDMNHPNPSFLNGPYGPQQFQPAPPPQFSHQGPTPPPYMYSSSPHHFFQPGPNGFGPAPPPQPPHHFGPHGAPSQAPRSVGPPPQQLQFRSDGQFSPTGVLVPSGYRSPRWAHSGPPLPHRPSNGQQLRG